MDSIDSIIIGAGVVGLAIARALALAGHETLVLEAEEGIGTQTSSRNSEVIHAGIYYPQGSLMARFCVAGKHQLYDYSAERGIAHKRCGKLIVATSQGEDARLLGIQARAAANGVNDLALLSREETLALEPALNCTSSLLSPSTGIIDSHAFMLSLQGDAENSGAMFSFHTPILGARAIEGGFEIDAGGAAPLTLRCKTLINSAGLQAPQIARQIAGMPRDKIPREYYARGNYFTCAGVSPFSRLIYPVPHPGGLGVHLTLDLAGQARFGPDVEWIDAINYEVDPARAQKFYAAIRAYWPDLRDGALQPAYAGVRPKIVPPEIAVQDFLIQGPGEHGLAGLVNLFGIESPGLTASMAIADHVAGMI